MAPTTTAAFAVPYFFAGLLVLVSLPAADRHPQPRGRRLLAPQPLALTDISSGNKAIRTAKEDAKLPSGWFGDFSQDESTYTTEGLDSSRADPEWAMKYGKDPELEAPYKNFEVLKSDFFHESQSGGPKAAWQTNYPSVESGIAGNRVAENPWRDTPTGWHQDYQTMPAMGAGNPSSADWFDNSVHQIDGFGRKMQPGLLDGQRLLSTGWLERSVNTTLSCKAIGCTARSSLQLLDMTKEEAKLCSLSIDIHPTDYDDDFSQEHVEFWKVNGAVATRQCNPKARGCNATASRPLYPCINGFNVDHLIDDKGTLVIEGQNSPMVDECPFEGNLLSGVAMATCMVRDKVVLQEVGTTATTTTLFTMADLLGEGVLKCSTPGCIAESTVLISPAIALNGGKCTMNITVHQTDFDDALGLPEQIDFVQVEGVNVSKEPIQPGKNPCNAAYKGTNLTDEDKVFSVLQNFDITQLVTKSAHLGELKVKGKISDQVDECGFEGMLLHGKVTVRCVPPAKFAAAPPPAQTALLHAPAEVTAPAQTAPSAEVTVPKSGKAPVLLQGTARRQIAAARSA